MREQLDRGEIVLPHLVRRWAERDPGRPFLEQIDGGRLSYLEADDAAARWSSSLRALGVGAGDRVLSMRRPHIDAITSWLGIAWLGAIDMSINTDYRGDMLRYVLANSGARSLIVSSEYLTRFGDIAGDLPPDAVVVVPDDDEPSHDLPVRVIGRRELFDLAAPDLPDRPPEPWDIAAIIYTSGTTGPSKGVLVPWAQLYATAIGTFPPDDLNGDDAYYSPFAMYHVSGKVPPVVAATCGGRVVVRETVSLKDYWEDIRRTKCTLGVVAGAICDELTAAPPDARDADLPLRLAVAGPVPPGVGEFGQRFGVQVGTAFNMTEVSVPLRTGWTIDDVASCGRVREGWPGYEVRIVDEHDEEVEPGCIGELIVRTAVPWTLNAGYLGYGDKTAEAWRNGWFHTGDAFKVDEGGNYFYVDRFKDAIRRRGENISSFEVEAAVLQHPDVVECAAIAVPSASSGDEIKICIVVTEGADLTEHALITWLAPRMPRFMVPRYVELLDALPKTEATLKVRKAELREHALNDRTWDRAAAGLEIPR